MRLDDSQRSENVEDRRGGGGGMRRMPGGPLAAGGLGALVLAVLAAVLSGDPSQILRFLSGGGQPTVADASGSRSPAEQEMVEFVRRVLGDTEQTWQELMGRIGKRYEEPRLVLFTGTVDSACGMAESAMGPFYCPGDRKVYIDLSFYDELRTRFRAPGDFAQAYVIAHEVGHHIQNLLGISDRVHRERERLSDAEYNKLSVRLELQADYLAGAWAHHANKRRRILEPGDVKEAMDAAAAIGDDRLQQKATGRVVPDSFTHGTSAQRMRWFNKGLETGDVDALTSGGTGDTFRARDL